MKGTSLIKMAAIAAIVTVTAPLLGDQSYGQRRYFSQVSQNQNVYSPNRAQKMSTQDSENVQQKQNSNSQNQSKFHPASYFKSDNKTVWQKAKEDPSLTTFVTAAEAAGLKEELDAGGPFTIFAPSNDAFRQLPKGTLERLMRPENQRELYMILAYHIVPGKVSSKEAKTKNVRTTNGKNANLEVIRGNISIDDAEVVRPDIQGKNGVIHVIDAVLLPNQN